jgi:hypothetical protein
MKHKHKMNTNGTAFRESSEARWQKTGKGQGKQ